jgi:hypothetical protein
MGVFIGLDVSVAPNSESLIWCEIDQVVELGLRPGCRYSHWSFILSAAASERLI